MAHFYCPPLTFPLVAFSESSFGRFLQSVELYILILFILLRAFWKDRSHTLSNTSYHGVAGTKQEYIDKSFKGLSNWQIHQSVFHVNPPILETPEAVADTKASDSIQSRGRASSIRYERRSRLSSWISKTHRTRRSRQSAEQLGINLDDPEQGYLAQQTDEEPLSANVGRNIQNFDLSSPTSSMLTTRPPLEETIGIGPITNSADKIPSAVQEKSDDATMSKAGYPSAGFSILSYYDEGRRKSPLWNTPPKTRGTGTESPVYGLDGIQQSLRPSSQKSRKRRSSMSSFEELMRQQRALDASIAALRLLTPSDPEMVFPLRDSGTDGSVTGRRSGRRSRSTRSMTALSTGTAPSEFSLSVFPEPPEVVERAEGASTRTSAQAVENGAPRTLAVRDDGLRIQTSKLPSSPNLHENGGVDGQPSTDDTRRTKVDSIGTQYDVTSFIGSELYTLQTVYS
jgi:hypothetical protein